VTAGETLVTAGEPLGAEAEVLIQWHMKTPGMAAAQGEKRWCIQSFCQSGCWRAPRWPDGGRLGMGKMVGGVAVGRMAMAGTAEQAALAEKWEGMDQRAEPEGIRLWC